MSYLVFLDEPKCVGEVVSELVKRAFQIPSTYLASPDDIYEFAETKDISLAVLEPNRDRTQPVIFTRLIKELRRGGTRIIIHTSNDKSRFDEDYQVRLGQDYDIIFEKPTDPEELAEKIIELYPAQSASTASGQ